MCARANRPLVPLPSYPSPPICPLQARVVTPKSIQLTRHESGLRSTCPQLKLQLSHTAAGPLLATQVIPSVTCDGTLTHCQIKITTGQPLAQQQYPLPDCCMNYYLGEPDARPSATVGKCLKSASVSSLAKSTAASSINSCQSAGSVGLLVHLRLLHTVDSLILTEPTPTAIAINKPSPFCTKPAF